MELADKITLSRDILLGLSAIAVAVFAWIGLRTWRRELTGKARFETARSMMRLGYELKDAFDKARHFITESYESWDRISIDESKAESQVLNEWHARRNRLNSVAESLNKMIEVQWEAEVLFDESSIQDIKEVVRSYRESYADLSSAVSSYFDVRHDEVRTGDRYKNQDWLKGLKRTIYSAPGDDFSKKIGEATDKLSSALRRYAK